MSLKSSLFRVSQGGIGLLLATLSSGCSDAKSPDDGAGGKSQSQTNTPDAGKSSAGKASSSGGKANSSGGEPSASGSNSAGKATGSGGTTPVGGGKSSAADVARKLGREANFLIGLGNELPGDYVWDKAPTYHLGATLDLHYIYLTNTWETWNEGGGFPKIIGSVDVAHGVTPMSTVWAITGNGENNFKVLVDEAYMKQYWATGKLLMQRYAELDVPALVHLEPDFWAFAQQKSGGDPTSVPVLLSEDCAGLPGDLTGMARCWFKLAHDNAPKVVIGLHASEWAGGAEDVGKFLNQLGIAEADLVIIDMLDRDAGCFEDAKLDICMRGGKFYLDETNETSPNYAERLAFAKQVSTTTGKPILWWQLPLGVPSDTPGGTPNHFRDNKVHYIFSHIQEFVDAGGLGAAFGAGAGQQTGVGTDDGQFDTAVTAYYANPVALP